MYIHVVRESYSNVIYDIEILPQYQNPSWDSAEGDEPPKGWISKSMGKGVKFYTEEYPLVKCLKVTFKFRVQATTISDRIRVHATDIDHENLGMIVSRRQ